MRTVAYVTIAAAIASGPAWLPLDAAQLPIRHSPFNRPSMTSGPQSLSFIITNNIDVKKMLN